MRVGVRKELELVSYLLAIDMREKRNVCTKLWLLLTLALNQGSD